MKVAIYPGSFDPVTNGHLDVIQRASHIVDRLVVAVLNNSEKHPVFSVEERVKMLQASIPASDTCEIVVSSFAGLLADYAQQIEATIVIKGLRALSDFEYEFMMALANRKINAQLDTVFLMTSEQYMYLSSSLVREIARHGGDVSDFVPAKIYEQVVGKLNPNRIS